jgi:hypothetical protein
MQGAIKHFEDKGIASSAGVRGTGFGHLRSVSLDRPDSRGGSLDTIQSLRMKLGSDEFLLVLIRQVSTLQPEQALVNFSDSVVNSGPLELGSSRHVSAKVPISKNNRDGTVLDVPDHIPEALPGGSVGAPQLAFSHGNFGPHIMKNAWSCWQLEQECLHA